ncbi:hypothetical protein QLX67_05745 [Balneolaceae bacterium ANBcel3]|nr:hypothetical protein [Balneolaceae bacterium ANBcel3]
MTRLWYLLWLLPLYLAGMMIHLGAVYHGLGSTYQHGESYIADVLDFEIKQIAAQTNGHITVRFDITDGTEVVRKLSQPIQNAAQLQASEWIPVRYKPSSYQPVVLVPIYEFHRKMVLVNLGVLSISFVVSLFLAILAHRYALRKTRTPDQPTSYRIIKNE